MPRTAARFTQADIARVLRAVDQAGVPMAVRVLPDGTIEIVPRPAGSHEVEEVREFVP